MAILCHGSLWKIVWIIVLIVAAGMAIDIVCFYFAEVLQDLFRSQIVVFFYLDDFVCLFLAFISKWRDLYAFFALK